jgi:ribonuclease D
VQYDHITKDRQFDELCARLRDVERICFDTEFVSEFNYRPDLCLLQVEYDGELAIVDTHAVSDVTPFWEVLVEGDHETIVHAGREEFRFCYAATEKIPKRWFDIQLAAGMVGHEYPISYGKLLAKLINTTLSKGETRTDWRRRPLTAGQMEYALQDVIHLPPVKQILQKDLERLGRTAWYEDEAKAWQQGVRDSETRERWRKVSGVSGLSGKALRIVREIWRWREDEARSRDSPPRRVLRDDLIVELARRGKADEKQIRAIRGIQRRDLNDQYSKIAEAIQRGLDSPPEKRMRNHRNDYPPQINLLGQFLGTALTSICRKNEIAASLVGTVQDVRDLIAYRLDFGGPDEIPVLASGWRSEIVGNVIEQLLAGELSLRIEDPKSSAPLVFDKVE